jgi:hypothetical protein
MSHKAIRTGLFRAAIFVIAVLASCAPAEAVRKAGAAISYKFADKNGLVILMAGSAAESRCHSCSIRARAPASSTPQRAAQLGIAAGASTVRRGGAGTFTSKAATRPVRLAFGTDILTCSETIITDLSGTTEVTGARLAGIVGGDFFRGRVVTIDYDRDLVTVQDRGTYRQRGGGTRLPIRVEKNRPFLTAKLSVPGGPQDKWRELLIDTGSLDHVGDSLLQEGTASLKSAAAQGLGTGFTIRSGTFSKVAIGPHVFRNVPGNVPSVPIVGAGILARFNPTFDYDGGWMILDKRSTRS